MLHHSAQRRVPPILDRVVRPPRQQLRDLRPLVVELRVRLDDRRVLLGGPPLLAHVGVEVVVPSLPDLLPRPPRHVGRQRRPRLDAKAGHQVGHPVVLLLRPGTLDALGRARRLLARLHGLGSQHGCLGRLDDLLALEVVAGHQHSLHVAFVDARHKLGHARGADVLELELLADLNELGQRFLPQRHPPLVDAVKQRLEVLDAEVVWVEADRSRPLGDLVAEEAAGAGQHKRVGRDFRSSYGHLDVAEEVLFEHQVERVEHLRLMAGAGDVDA
mmetsp:Transcript_9035/g.20724  ORF Transcript_9035/g.20724 Transcript_9035/m.20724 type:complete len:273 (-) Transcript_9035:226-1044(-)